METEYVKIWTCVGKKKKLVIWCYLVLKEIAMSLFQSDIL